MSPTGDKSAAFTGAAVARDGAGTILAVEGRILISVQPVGIGLR